MLPLIHLLCYTPIIELVWMIFTEHNYHFRSLEQRDTTGDNSARLSYLNPVPSFVILDSYYCHDEQVPWKRLHGRDWANLSCQQHRWHHWLPHLVALHDCQQLLLPDVRHSGWQSWVLHHHEVLWHICQILQPTLSHNSGFNQLMLFKVAVDNSTASRAS